METNKLETMRGIERVILESRAFKLVSREFQQEDTVIEIDNVKIGNNSIVIIAGPCAVENEKQTLETAHAVNDLGADILRGGAFKPRTSLYSFQGLGEDGLKILSKAKEETGLPVITEVMSIDQVELVVKHSDILQIGCRNMQNFNLLLKVGKAGKPVLLKRGFTATLEEFLLAAEYIIAQGNSNVILCERGIRTFEPMTRNTLDLSAVPMLKKLSHLPVLVDPSHATGVKDLIIPMAKAAVAAGADAIMVDVHTNPEQALCDGPQALLPEDFKQMMEEVKKVAKAVGRDINE